MQRVSCSELIDLRWIFRYYRVRFHNAFDLLECLSVEFEGSMGSSSVMP